MKGEGLIAMSKEQGKSRRRTMLADKHAQARMIRRLCLLPMIVLAVMGLVVILSVVGLLIEVQASHVVLSFLPLVAWSVALFVAASAGCMFLTSFEFSYRVAGPTYRILKSLEEFQHYGGDFKIQLRAGDELQDLAAKLNEVMHKPQAEAQGTATTAELSTASTSD